MSKMDYPDEPELTPFECDLLRHLAGEDVPGLAWGAAMSVAVRYLQGKGYATRGSRVLITDAGRAALAKSTQST